MLNTDLFNITDSKTATGLYFRSLNETVTTLESFYFNATGAIRLLEAFNTLDILSEINIGYRNLIETATIFDDKKISFLGLNKELTNLTDTFIHILLGIKDVLFLESLNNTDALKLIFDYKIKENVSLIDLFSAENFAFNYAFFADMLNVNDDLYKRSLKINVNLFNITESYRINSLAVKNESNLVTDIYNLIIKSKMFESTTITDFAIPSAILERIFYDTATIYDIFYRLGTTRSIFTDAIEITELYSKTLWIKETYGIVEAKFNNFNSLNLITLNINDYNKNDFIYNILNNLTLEETSTSLFKLKIDDLIPFFEYVNKDVLINFNNHIVLLGSLIENLYDIFRVDMGINKIYSISRSSIPATSLAQDVTAVGNIVFTLEASNEVNELITSMNNSILLIRRIKKPDNVNI